MLSTPRGQQLFGASTALSLLLAFTSLFDPVSSVPSQLFANELSRRAEPAGIGFEFELGNFVIKGPTDMEGAKRELVKGRTMTPVGLDFDITQPWKLTVEVSNLVTVMPEIIVDGLTYKVGEQKTKEIAQEIIKYMDAWAPCRNGGCKVKVEDFNDQGDWIVQWPKDAIDAKSIKITPQVTTALPLGGILQILKDWKAGTKGPLTSGTILWSKNIEIVDKDDFKTFKKIKPADIDEEFLGFFSLLASYCVLAEKTDRSKGPKHLLPVMPRTNFVAMYDKFIEKKLAEQFKDKKVSLYDIIEKITKKDDKLGKTKFAWKVGETDAVTETWDDKADDIKAAELEVEKFVNYVQGYDPKAKKVVEQMDLLSLMDKAMRHGQIGARGKKMEKVFGSTDEAPIVELRDLEAFPGAELETLMDACEDAIVKLHQKKYNKRDIEDSTTQCD